MTTLPDGMSLRDWFAGHHSSDADIIAWRPAKKEG